MPQTTAVVLENRQLRVEVNRRDLAAHVLVKASGETLRMAGAQDNDVLLAGTPQWKSFAESPITIRKAGAAALSATLQGVGLRVGIRLHESDVLFEVAPLRARGAVAREVLYPRHFALPTTSDAYATFPLGQGQLIPGNWPTRFHHREGYSEATANWLGGYTGKTGYCAIAETPDDLYQAVDHQPGAAASVFFHWTGSLGKLAYPRRVRYRFGKGLDYVAQAKLFRAHCQRIGQFRSLRDKIAENPNVARLVGTPVVSFSACSRVERTLSYHCNRFTDLAKWLEAYRRQSGFADGMVHLDGWGWWGYDAMHPDPLPPNMDAGGVAGLAELARRVKAAGYLFGLHDQYIDFYFHAPSYDESLSIVTEDGRPVRINRWNGGPCGHLCYTRIPHFVRRNFYEGVRKLYPHNHNSPSIWEICRPTASYMDCFCRTVECWSKDHPFTRTQARELQREIFQIVRGGKDGEGIVLSCEHIRDYGVSLVDFSYAMTNFVCDVITTTGQHATRPVGLQAPLWELVFHDAVSLFCWRPGVEGLLYGQSPLVHLEGKPVPRSDIARQRVLAAFHRDVALAELTGHKFLSSDGTVQSCTYGSGLTIEADLAKNTYRINDGRSRTPGLRRL